MAKPKATSGFTETVIHKEEKRTRSVRPTVQTTPPASPTKREISPRVDASTGLIPTIPTAAAPSRLGRVHLLSTAATSSSATSRIPPCRIFPSAATSRLRRHPTRRRRCPRRHRPRRRRPRRHRPRRHRPRRLRHCPQSRHPRRPLRPLHPTHPIQWGRWSKGLVATTTSPRIRSLEELDFTRVRRPTGGITVARCVQRSTPRVTPPTQSFFNFLRTTTATLRRASLTQSVTISAAGGARVGATRSKYTPPTRGGASFGSGPTATIRPIRPRLETWTSTRTRQVPARSISAQSRRPTRRRARGVSG